MRYLGGKSRIAGKIAPYLLRHERHTYLEPFVGGIAVAERVAPHFDKAYLSDIQPDVIMLYRGLQDGTFTPPSEVTREQWEQLRHAEPSALRAFAGYGVSFGGAWFRSYAANDPRNNYVNQTTNSLARAKKRGVFDAHVHFSCRSFFDIDPADYLPGTVVYCDPPYNGREAYDAVDAFDSNAAWEKYAELAAAGLHVYVSEYDGPSDKHIATFYPTASFSKTNQKRGKAQEKLFYFPPAGGVEHV